MSLSRDVALVNIPQANIRKQRRGHTTIATTSRAPWFFTVSAALSDVNYGHNVALNAGPKRTFARVPPSLSQSHVNPVSFFSGARA